jgi:hypothetical protein
MKDESIHFGVTPFANLLAKLVANLLVNIFINLLTKLVAKLVAKPCTHQAQGYYLKTIAEKRSP